jgi:magnesium-transporting ATPase (P-type)
MSTKMKIRYIFFAIGLFLVAFLSNTLITDSIFSQRDLSVYFCLMVIGALSLIFIAVGRLGSNFKPFLRSSFFWKISSSLVVLGLLAMLVVKVFSVFDPFDAAFRNYGKIYMGIYLLLITPPNPKVAVSRKKNFIAKT